MSTADSNAGESKRRKKEKKKQEYTPVKVNKVVNENKGKAVVMFSGGLDSSLAVRIVSDMGYEVTALHIATPFGNLNLEGKEAKPREGLMPAVSKTLPVGDDYIDMIKNPKYGYGKNINPCVDCKIFMLGKAKAVMDEIGADFIVTGEVLGQRPKSQNAEMLQAIMEDSELEGKLLRPLCGQLYPPIDAEVEGKIKREDLYDFNGRNRTPQMELADKLGVKDYPAPAGGCLLCEEHYATKLAESFKYGEDSVEHMHLLKLGRHYRMEDGTKIVVGRDSKENDYLQKHYQEGASTVTVKGYGSTYAFLFGNATEENLNYAGSVVARYSKAKKLDNVEIMWWQGIDDDSKEVKTYSAAPAALDELNKYKID